MLTWLVLCAFIFIGSYHLYITEIEQTIENIKKEEINQLNLEKRSIEHTLSSALDDLEILARQNELIEYISGNNDDVHEFFAKEYQTFIQEKDAYAQIRFLDVKGMERIRVELKDESVEIIPTNLLQDKSNRPYFSEALKLDPGQIYISHLDLNIENGKVEKPFKPMIRFSRPIYVNQNKVAGVIVINYLGDGIIDFVSKVDGSTFASTYLLNNSGYWLYSDVVENNWAFMFPEAKEVSFRQSFPELWNQMNELKNGEIDNSDQWTAFVTVDPLGNRYNRCMNSSYIKSHKCHYAPKASRRSWKLVAMVTRDNISEIEESMLAEYIVISGLLCLVMLLPSVLIGHGRVKQREYDVKLLHMAHYDKLTNLPNRALFYDRLEQGINLADRTGKTIGLLYIDLDGFKTINDTIGHDAGDIVLQAAAERLGRCIRASDTASRIGGDEFAVMLSELEDPSASEVVAQRIIDALSEPLLISGQSCKVGASIGISYYPQGAAELNELIVCADKAMYQSKESGKNCFTVFQ